MTSFIEEKASESEYKFLTETWNFKDKIGYQSTGEICYENGWIDDFGFVTPKGKRAIEDFEKNQEQPKDDHPDASPGPIEDFDIIGRVDVV